MARKKKPDDTIEDLNLVPIMNLVVCLIPIVLLGTSLVKIGVVNVNAPKFGVADTPPDDTTEKPLDLTVAVGEDGFRISASGADIHQVLGLAPTPDATTGALIAKQGDHYDYVALYNLLVQIKEKFPEESVIKLTGDARVPFKSFPTKSGPSGVPGCAPRPRREAAAILGVLQALRNAGVGVQNGAPRRGGFCGEALKVMLATMDAIRVRLEQDSYDDIEGFRTAAVHYAGHATELLWSDVVFAVAQ